MCVGSSNVFKGEKTCQEPLSSDEMLVKSKWNKSSAKSKSGKTYKTDNSKGPVFIGPSLPPHQIQEPLPTLKVYWVRSKIRFVDPNNIILIFIRQNFFYNVLILILGKRR